MYSNELVCNILNYINNHINREITIEELSNLFFFNQTYIMKKFKKELGISIHQYINHTRIYNSLKEFKNNEYFIKIAFNNGFNSLEYFSETFKKIMGVTPRTYKKFILFRFNISDEDLLKIRLSLIKLHKLNTDIIKYQNNRRPTTTPIKKIVLTKN